MRVTHVIPRLPWPSDEVVIGGHASTVASLAKAQKLSGLDVDILTGTTRYGDQESQSARSERAFLGPVPVRTLSLPSKPESIGFAVRLAKGLLAWAWANRSDRQRVLHFHTGVADYTAIFGPIAAISAARSLLTIYCPWHLQALPFPRLAESQLRRFDSVLGSSESVRDSLAAVRPDIDVTVCLPVIDCRRFTSAFDVTHSSKRSRRLLFVGNLKPAKNLERVCEAFLTLRRQGQDVELIVAVDLSEAKELDARAVILARELRRMESEGIVSLVRVIDDVPRLLRSVDCLVVPFIDSFGPSDFFMIVLEALACGTPVVSSDVGGTGWVVRESGYEVVDPTSARSIADGVDSVLQMAPAQLISTRQRGQAIIEQHFDAEARVQELLSAYGITADA